jgi:hypothetical protein
LATRLVEETETHVLVGLLLLLLLGSLRSGLLGSTTSGSSSAAGSGTTTGSARGNGSELGRALLDELVDVLALKLGDELVETVGVSLDTNGFEDSLFYCQTLNAASMGKTAYLNIGGGRRGVATKAEEEVCSEVLHCGCGWVIWELNRR